MSSVLGESRRVVLVDVVEPVNESSDSANRRAEILRILKRGGASNGLVDEIALAVVTDVVEGRLHPGDDLNSVELARTFKTSRTPVREALLILEREGLVQSSAHRRPRVATLSIRDVHELYELRATLYAVVSRAVVRVAEDTDLVRLRDVQTSLEKAVANEDVDAYFWLNVDFRNTEIDIAGDSTLRRVMDGLGLRTLQLRHLSLSLPGRLEQSLADHERLVRAYEERDAELAAALTQSLVRRGLAAIERSGWTGDGI
jgi:DNA-binding GntR family transcriptional regulator